MQLRPYQVEAVNAVKASWQSHSDVLFVMATGGGKTQVLLSVVIDELKRTGGRALVIAHRRELISQPIERIGQIDPDWLHDSFEPRVGVIMAERNDTRCQLTIATVQSLTARGKQAREGGRYPRIEALLAAGPIDYFIIDECHHGVSQSYVTVLEELKRANPSLKHLGVTATPIRGDGNGLKSVYQHTAMVISIADLVKMHYLVQPRWLGIKTNISLKGVATSGGDFSASDLADRFDTPAGRRVIVESFLKYTSDRKAVAFTASVKGAHELAEAFNAVGISAAAVDGTTDKGLRAQILADFAAGRYQVLANCAVLTEGWDCPSVTAVLMCRPTKSDGLYVQCMGRGLRPANGIAETGEDCVILDFLPEETRNIVMAGDVLGLPKDVTRTVIKETDEDEEEGFVQAGFTFDGVNFDSGGTPLEIVARQLDYLQSSRWQWDRRDGWMTLGLGPGEDGIDRVMAIAPGDACHTLYGLRRDPVGEDDNGRAKYGQWYIVFERFGEVDRLCEAAERLADKYAVGALAGKGRSWHKKEASPAAVSYLRRLMPKGARLPGYITSGECSSLISYWQIRNALNTTSRTS